MADIKKSDVEVVEEPPKKKSKSKLFIILGVVCLALAGGGAFFFLKQQKTPAEGENGAEAAAREQTKPKKVEPGAPPVFYKFDKPFTVKLQTEQQEAYLQAEVQLKLLDQSGVELMKQYEPQLKHQITLSLMNNKASNLATAAGVQRLANELRDVANKLVTPPETGEPSAPTEPAAVAEPGAVVQSVLFSSFLIQ